MFVVKVYYKNGKSPWALNLTEPVPEAFEFPASDWPQNFLWSISEEEPGDSDLFLHEVVFLIDRHDDSFVARSTWKASPGKFQNFSLTKPEKLQALTWLQETNTLR